MPVNSVFAFLFCLALSAMAQTPSDESVVAVSMVQPDIDRLWRWPFVNVLVYNGAPTGALPGRVIHRR